MSWWSMNDKLHSAENRNSAPEKRNKNEFTKTLLLRHYLLFSLFPFLQPAGKNCTLHRQFSHAQCELFYWTILMHLHPLCAARKKEETNRKVERKSIRPAIDAVRKEMIHCDGTRLRATSQERTKIKITMLCRCNLVNAFRVERMRSECLSAIIDKQFGNPWNFDVIRNAINYTRVTCIDIRQVRRRVAIASLQGIIEIQQLKRLAKLQEETKTRQATTPRRLSMSSRHGKQSGNPSRSFEQHRSMGKRELLQPLLKHCWRS